MPCFPHLGLDTGELFDGASSAGAAGFGDLSCSQVLLAGPGPDPSTSSSCWSQSLGQNFANERMG